MIDGPPDPFPVLREKIGLKMTSLEADTHGHVGLVRLTADDGSEGWGVRVSPAWLEKAERQRPEA